MIGLGLGLGLGVGDRVRLSAPWVVAPLPLDCP